MATRRQAHFDIPYQDNASYSSHQRRIPPLIPPGYIQNDIEAKIRRTNSLSLLPFSSTHTHRYSRFHLRNLSHSILHPSQRWKSRLRTTLFFFLALLILDIFLITSHTPRSTRVTLESVSTLEPKSRIYVAGIHRNSEKVLYSHWNSAVIDLVKFYGADNIFVSLYESGSIEGTKGALARLDNNLRHLGVRTSIVLDEADQILEVEKEVNEAEEGWVFTKRGKYELRRIPYLASLREKVMERLYKERESGRAYDFVLWLNDVVFNTEDITTLLSTNNGSFDAACSLDFKKSHEYYDTFALRSLHGTKVSKSWPYFSDSASQKSLRNMDAVRVSSCWNGIVAFPASSFYHGLKFKGIPDDLAQKHLEGSECCLIHIDNDILRSSVAKLESHGTWLNPNVRVAYSGPVYESVTSQTKVWPTSRDKVIGTWKMRLGGIIRPVQDAYEAKVVKKRIRAWQRAENILEAEIPHVGEHCLINEMQVLEGAGWRHL